MRTRIKICGITRPEDALAASLLGVDAIGLVFHEKSPRRVDIARAAAIVEVLPPFVDAVALFVDAAAEAVWEVLEGVAIDVLQFHGDETPAFCGGFGLPYLKAVRMRDGVDLQAEGARYEDAAALLLDAWHPDVAGGTGKRFKWRPIPAGVQLPVMLAGGLEAGNVAGGIDIMRPYGVDVSSGVETSGGIKDADRMRQFVHAVMQADNMRADDRK